jgi:hypothetical protein
MSLPPSPPCSRRAALAALAALPLAGRGDHPLAKLRARLASTPRPAVLFLGNSYSFEAPRRLAALAKQAGWALEVEQRTQGGWTLAQHAASPESLAALRHRPWDAVVLQEQSRIPSLPEERTRRFLPALAELVPTIQELGACPVLYQTWGRRDGDRAAAPLFPGDTRAAMQARLDEGFALACAAHPGLAAVPVGAVWMAWVDNPQRPTPYAADGSHPNGFGHDLIAATFFAAFRGAVPPQPEPDHPELREARAHALRIVNAGHE